jgi:ABC-2 type transport system permease protein
VVSILVSDDAVLPSAAGLDIVLAVVWFVLGTCVYAFVFAALAALVDKVTEVNSALMPVNVVLIGSYLLAVLVVTSTPQSWMSVAGSIVPFSAPLVMPARWASGGVPVWQLVVSMALTAATAVLVARAASAVYRRGVVRTGRRLPLKEALRV